MRSQYLNSGNYRSFEEFQGHILKKMDSIIRSGQECKSRAYHWLYLEVDLRVYGCYNGAMSEFSPEFPLPPTLGERSDAK